MEWLIIGGECNDFWKSRFLFVLIEFLEEKQITVVELRNNRQIILTCLFSRPFLAALARILVEGVGGGDGGWFEGSEEFGSEDLEGHCGELPLLLLVVLRKVILLLHYYIINNRRNTL
jgi:hypothetical protein